MLNRAHRAHFPNRNGATKKRDILSEKRESWMALKKREFTPESGNVDTYVVRLTIYAHYHTKEKER